ncbi:MAG: helix-turn-helix transcriptional regulator [Sphingobacteriales bacterium JAD_PAG50586_3]|nr:MAG: helix-turn-helix transcriptional regulator [Sphingobacteriales bacterium JAD_PAG50586_3]
MRKENSTNSINREALINQCPVNYTLELIGGRWKTLILFNLQNKPLRFSELKRALPGVTEKMLTQQLRELEADNLLTRTVYAEVPPRVEYSLTDLGKSLQPVLINIAKWGLSVMPTYTSKQARA